MTKQILHITIPGKENWDSVKEEFIYEEDAELYLQHSLVTVAEWEARWKISFLDTDNKTPEQITDYIKIMTINQNEVDDSVYKRLTKENLDEINRYLKDEMSATTITDHGTPESNGRNEIITAEIVYYWMFSHNVPVEFENWHFNRLITLLKTCNIKSNPDNKMTKQETAKMYAEMNKARRQKYNSKG